EPDPKHRPHRERTASAREGDGQQADAERRSHHAERSGRGAVPAFHDFHHRAASGRGALAQTISGMMRIATMFATLIIGLIAGPAVSLYGSPTVSPVTDAAWASEPLPPYSPSSISFFALSHAPPPEVIETAVKKPTT